MVRIRLQRVGKKRQPSYRVVVIDSDAPATGRPVETIGHYNPRTEPITYEIDRERALYWLGVGAQPSEAVHRLLVKSGIMDMFARMKAGEEVEVREEEAEPAIAPVAAGEIEGVLEEEE
jgi:small subunit ribosomal protein S16